jgi:hypothetical protein
VLQSSGKCLEHEAITVDAFGYEVFMSECNGGLQQLWTYDEARKSIVSSNSSWCLVGFPPSGCDGCDIFVSRCHSSSSGFEQWDYDVDAKTLKLTEWDEYCLEGDLSMRLCNDQTNQKWNLE